jgi:hypothetical protein
VELVKAAFVYKRQLEERSSVLRGMQRCMLDLSASTQVSLMPAEAAAAWRDSQLTAVPWQDLARQLQACVKTL